MPKVLKRVRFPPCRDNEESVLSLSSSSELISSFLILVLCRLVKTECGKNDDTKALAQVMKLNLKLGACLTTLFPISINLLEVYRESVNLIGYITRRLSADSLQL